MVVRFNMLCLALLCMLTRAMRVADNHISGQVRVDGAIVWYDYCNSSMCLGCFPAEG